MTEKYLGNKTKKKRQHYVPIFYLDNFTNENGTFWIHDKDNSRSFESNPNNVCSENYLYEFESNDCVFSNGKHLLPNSIENKFAELEGDWSKLIQTVLKRLSIQTNPQALIIRKDEREQLYDLINNLLIRNPRIMELFLSDEQIYESIGDCSDFEVLNEMFKTYKFGSTAGFKKSIIKNLYFDKNKGLSYIENFEKMSFVFLKSCEGDFITSDFPIIMDIDFENGEFKTLYFPISTKYAINFFREKTRDRNQIRMINNEQVEDLNNYVYKYKFNRFIISKEKIHL